MKSYILSFLILSLTASFAFIPYNGNWELGDDYAVQFDASKAQGNFSEIGGTINFDPTNPGAANFDMWVMVNTIETGNKTKNKHAVGNKWFDAETYPKVTLKSSTVRKKGEAFEFKGIVTIKETQKEIVFPFTFQESGTGGEFKGSFVLERKEFGLDGPFLYGGLVGKEVTVNLKIPVTQ